MTFAAKTYVSPNSVSSLAKRIPSKRHFRCKSSSGNRGLPRSRRNTLLSGRAESVFAPLASIPLLAVRDPARRQPNAIPGHSSALATRERIGMGKEREEAENDGDRRQGTDI